MNRMYILEGIPTAWARPGIRGGSWIYDSQKKIKRDWAIVLEGQHNEDPLFEGPLHLEITFFFPIAESKSRIKTHILGKPHHYRPDLSNLIKLVEDVATGIIYRDDSLISSITAHKKYGDSPRTEFSLTPL